MRTVYSLASTYNVEWSGGCDLVYPNIKLLRKTPKYRNKLSGTYERQFPHAQHTIYF